MGLRGEKIGVLVKYIRIAEVMEMNRKRNLLMIETRKLKPRQSEYAMMEPSDGESSNAKAQATRSIKT